MKRIIASFAAMAAFAAAAPAMAGDQNFTPHGGLPLFEGTLDVSQSIVSTTCTSTFAVSFSNDGKYAAVYAAAFSGTSLCNGLVPSNYPWPITITNPGVAGSGGAVDLRVDNIYIKTSAGYCDGGVNGKWLSAGNGAIQFNNASLPGKIKVGLIEVNAACSIDGTLTANIPTTASRL